MVNNLAELLQSAYPVLPVIVIDDLERVVPLAETLYEKGIQVIEVTLRTPCALQAIELIKTTLPEMKVGAGTVVQAAQVQPVIDAGADFVVSPGISEELLESSREHDFPLLPGVMTPSDILRAIRHNIKLVKLFPAASAGGVDYLKSLAGPFSEIRFCPTGGINSGNYREYLELDNVICVGGSWLTPSALVREQRWAEIGKLAESLM